MRETLRVGFVGTGGIARGQHIPAWNALPGAEIVAIADIDPDAAAKGAALAGVEEQHLYDDYEKMLEAEELDVVDVCTPNCVHMPPTVAALEAGCHVFVEKPVAISADQVRQMIAARDKSQKLLCVTQNMRYSDEAIAAKRFVDAGGIGDIYWGRAEYLRARGVPAWGAFIDAEKSAGGPCYDIGVHVLDLTLHFMNFPEPVSVSANTWLEIANKPSVMAHDPRKYTVPEELAAGFIRFENGSCISLAASWALNATGNNNNISVFGNLGGVQMWPFTLVTEQHGMMLNCTPQVIGNKGLGGHAEEIRRFVAAIHGRGPVPVPPEQTLITQRILDGIYKSGQEGAEVKV
ncbi:MAG: Gfo/Idh/MocA family oxidoreductase [candidate division WS1 bacterium]|nr:Gfo/Idh/MocA family oxidoreductase [candidate division WS1 bacterium]